MQVGQILVEQRWVAPDALARALAEQRHTGKRICSLLIARGLLDPDNAARALANQHNVAGVLQKHLEHRDAALARLLPAALARACFALPIGRTRNQELIVCVRDPRPELKGILSQAVGSAVVIAVAPAAQLEQLLKLVYEGVASPIRAPEVSFEVDLSTRIIPTVHDDPAAAPAPAPAAAPAAAAPAPDAPVGDEVEVDLRTRHIPIIADIGDLGSMTLVELDDVRVTKDPSQSGQQAALLPRTTTTPYPPLSRGTIAPQPPLGRATMAAPQSPPRAATGPNPPRTTTSPYPSAAGSPSPSARTGATHALAMVMPTLDATIAALDRTSALDDATELAMRYLAGRFHHAVLFTIHEGAALGFRGYGNQLTDEVIHAITVPLSAPSIIQAAHDTRRLATTPPAGTIQDRLARTLGSPQAFAAVPIEVDARVAYVIAVGDAAGDQTNAGYDLERLGRVLGAAYQRLPR
ncbi:MAG TPA: hypothetical protein VLM79_02965 [Kofleriaceae bacterium]|nr:hypothetical protein [Kofleriaceae bacterium]